MVASDLRYQIGEFTVFDGVGGASRGRGAPAVRGGCAPLTRLQSSCVVQAGRSAVAAHRSLGCKAHMLQQVAKRSL